MANQTWLRISLFCNRSIAHRVLRESVEPFIMQCRESKSLQLWFFEFNNLLGENIRLSLLVPLAQAPTVSSSAKIHFSSFFEQLNAPKKSLSFPLNGIFLPFPENSIQFGLFNVTNDKEVAVPDLVQRISATLVDAIGEDEIDEEMVLTLALYMQLALKKEVLHLRPNIEGLLKSFYETAGTGAANALIPEFYGKRVDDNYAVIEEISHDIYNAGFYDEHPWLGNWANLCREALNGDDSSGSIQRLIDVPMRQLGVSFPQLQLVRYLVLSAWDLKNGIG